jgi:hypothetical protein
MGDIMLSKGASEMNIFMALDNGWLILVFFIAGTALFLLGFYWMGKIDQFSSQGGFRRSFSHGQSILVYGNDILAQELIQVVSLKTCTIHAIDSPDFSLYPQVRLVVALGESDLDNLMICRLSKHLNPTVATIAFCQDKTHERLYLESKVDHLLMGQPAIDKVRQYLEEMEL